MPLQLNTESDAFLITDPINIRGEGVILITEGHESFLISISADLLIIFAVGKMRNPEGECGV